jgi:hypothetical protein
MVEIYRIQNPVIGYFNNSIITKRGILFIKIDDDGIVLHGIPLLGNWNKNGDDDYDLLAVGEVPIDDDDTEPKVMIIERVEGEIVVRVGDNIIGKKSSIIDSTVLDSLDKCWPWAGSVFIDNGIYLFNHQGLLASVNNNGHVIVPENKFNRSIFKKRSIMKSSRKLSK